LRAISASISRPDGSTSAPLLSLGADQDSPLLRQKPCRVLADRAEALHNHACVGQIELDELTRHVDAGGEAEAGGADLVERDTADRGRQSSGAAGLVLDPAHAELVRSHVRPGDVVGDVADRVRERTHHRFLSIGRHAGLP
jgi:hypothetical protein